MYIFVLEPAGLLVLNGCEGKSLKKKSEKSGVGVQQKPPCHQWIFKTPFEGQGAIFQGGMSTLTELDRRSPRATIKVSG